MTESNNINDRPRIDRRVALKWIAAATSVPALSGVSWGAGPTPEAKGYGPDPDVTKVYQPGDFWPLTFTDAQRKLVSVLCDLIIPADEQSPSASAVGVPDFLDEWISSPYPDQARDRSLILKGLESLDEMATQHGGKDFVSLKPAEQLALCKDLAKAAKTDAKKFPGNFFLRLRDLIAGGYYTTPLGMRDLGYRGNIASIEWTGPPPEVLEKLGLSAQE
ncbi:MAG: gluconate 2-dehydrogenase subunit 3 family protein [Verrucomicrobiae bacterium]|nr:gluconate 2-dehydrogenase subunit 3 family protein [Verrucomicrobiae bacterium]